jgi:hypothetical protein
MLVLYSPLKYGIWHIADKMLQVTIKRSIFERLGDIADGF